MANQNNSGLSVLQNQMNELKAYEQRKKDIDAMSNKQEPTFFGGTPSYDSYADILDPKTVQSNQRMRQMIEPLLMQRLQQMSGPQQFNPDMYGDPEYGLSDLLGPIFAQLGGQGAQALGGNLGNWFQGFGQQEEPQMQPQPSPTAMNQYPGVSPEIVNLMENLTSESFANASPEVQQQVQDLTNKHGIAESRKTPFAKARDEAARQRQLNKKIYGNEFGNFNENP